MNIISNNEHITLTEEEKAKLDDIKGVALITRVELASSSDELVVAAHLAVPTEDDNKAILDSGCTFTIFKSEMYMTNKVKTTASVGGVTEDNNGITVTKGVRAGLDAIVLPNARHNLLSTRAVMNAAECGIMMLKDKAYFIQEKHAEDYITKMIKSKRIIRTVVENNEGLLEMTIPATFRKDNTINIEALHAIGCVVADPAIGIPEYDGLTYPEESTVDLDNRIKEFENEYWALMAHHQQQLDASKIRVQSFISEVEEAELNAEAAAALHKAIDGF